MKKTTKRRQNGGGAGASVPESIGSLLCKQAIKGMRTGMNQSTIIELLNNIEDLDKGYITDNNCIDNKTGASLLIIASIKGYIDVVKYLITKGVDINFINKMGNTALHVAALNGNINVVKELLNNPNCNKIMFNKQGYTPLQLAIASSANLDSIIEIIEEFKLKSIIINAHTTFGYGPLHIVALNNKHEIIPFLAVNGAIVDSKTYDDNQYTPLHIACINGYEEVAKALLSIDANPDILSKQQWSSIYYAAQKGYTNIVRDLLTNGANPHISPLSPPGAGGVAFFNGRFELADLIWKETAKSPADIEKEKNGSKTQNILKYKILEDSVDNYYPDGSNDYDYAADTGYLLNFEEAAASDAKPGGSKRAYTPRKTRRQSKRRRRQNKK